MLYWRSRWRRSVIAAVYITVILVEFYFWPGCEVNAIPDDWYEFDNSELALPPKPSNLLSPPMWNSAHPTGGCGKWQKTYTTLHREMLSGERPASYLVYTTGMGFPPHIESVSHALKGIGTVFMLALLTDRAFILDWKSPAGFENQVSPRKINWRSTALFHNGLPRRSVHDIGSSYWFDGQGRSVHWYMETDFNQYFTDTIEIIQSHNYDFTYALLRNRHHQERILEYGLHKARCLLCCFWHNLFKLSPSLERSMHSFLRKAGWSKSSDIVFLNIPIPNQRFPKGHVMRLGKNVVQCTEKATKSLNLKKPIWILASNNFMILEGILRYSPYLKKDGRVYSQERYMIDIQRENSTKKHTMKLPMTEQNALFHFATGFFLQLNSTVLVSDHRSVYSESMAAYRHFYYQSNRYLVYYHDGCQIQRFRV